MVVDPAPGSFGPISTYLQENSLIPDKLILTHSHWDHTAETSLFKKKFNLPVYIHESDVGNLETPGSDGLPCWISIEGVKPDVLLKEGDIVSVGDLNFEVIHTPGHTPGGICLHCKEQHTLISGDTLFQGTIGNLSFPTARPHLMWKSLEKLAQLPPQTKVYPGHGPSTTIGAETWLADAENLFG